MGGAAYFDSLERELVRIASYTAGSMIGGGALVGAAFLAVIEGQPWLAASSGVLGIYALVCGSDGYDDRRAILERYGSYERAAMERRSSPPTVVERSTARLEALIISEPELEPSSNEARTC
jgi:hypothetical protein